MRKLYLLFFMLLISVVASTQNINETLEYINDKLKKYDHGTFEYNAYDFSDDDINRHDYLSILKTGEVIVKRIINIEGVSDEPYEPFEVRFYLKNLSDTVLIQEDFDDSGNLYYTILIQCETDDCMILSYKNEPKSELRKYYGFALIDSLYSQRVYNALTRLIVLGKKEDSYLKDDPFK